MHILYLPIVARKIIAKDTTEVSFGLNEQTFSFKAGQYIRVMLPSLLPNDPKGNFRDFSIVNAPGEKVLTVAFRTRQPLSPFKQELLGLPLGTTIKVSGPHGELTLEKTLGGNSVFVAGGIGITSFIGKLAHVQQAGLPTRFTLIFSDTNKESAPYLDRVEAIAKNCSQQITVKTIFNTPITKAWIEETLTDPTERIWQLAGPTRLLDDLCTTLSAIGVPKEFIFTEEYTGYETGISAKSHAALQPGYTKAARGKEELEWLRVFFEAVNRMAIVSESNVAGDITYGNAKLMEISKYTLAELIGENHRIVKSNYHSREFYEDLWRTISTGKVWRGEIKNRAKDGSFYWVDTSIAPILDTDGTPVQYASVRFDITQKKVAEAEAQRLASIVENTSDAIVGRSLDGIITSWNRGAEKMLGHTAKEAIGQHMDLIVPPSRRDEVATLVQRIVDGGYVPSEIETKRTHKDGTELDVAVTLSPIRDIVAGNKIVGMASLIRDITLRKKTESELRQARNRLEAQVEERTKEIMYINQSLQEEIDRRSKLEDKLRTHAAALALADRRKNEFISILSHELRNPLTSILVYNELLNREIKKLIETGRADASLSRDIETITHHGQVMARLLNDLLDLSRIMTGKIVLKKETMDLVVTAKQAIEAIQNVLDTKRDITFITEEQSLLLIADPVRIEQILINLLHNAIKYSDAHTVVTLTLTASEDHIKISVRDEGIGIEPAILKHIFDLFTQADPAVGRASGGLGIGLAIVKNMVELHHGSVEAHSAGHGKGSEFIINLPRGVIKNV